MEKPNYAGFWVRYWASVIDGLVLTLVTFALLAAGVLAWAVLSGSAAQEIDSFFRSLDGLVVQIIQFGIYGALSILYYGWGSFRFGTTLGKRVFHIYLVRSDSLERISLAQALGRVGASFISAAILFGGYLMVAFHPRKQGLHDLLAGTLSVRGEQYGALYRKESARPS